VTSRPFTRKLWDIDLLTLSKLSRRAIHHVEKSLLRHSSRLLYSAYHATALVISITTPSTPTTASLQIVAASSAVTVAATCTAASRFVNRRPCEIKAACLAAG
jgi:hypothetical protein